MFGNSKGKFMPPEPNLYRAYEKSYLTIKCDPQEKVKIADWYIDFPHKLKLI
jgi:hypothetical protein